MNAKCSSHDGGQLSYLLLSREGSALFSASAGYRKGIFTGLEPDVAVLGIGGRPNVDGEPFQGSSARNMLEQMELLRPGRVAFCHHDPLFPRLPWVDIDAATDALKDAPSGYFDLEYATPRPLFS